MANLISIPCLEKEGYHIKYDSDEEWVVNIPKGVIIPFNRDKGVTRGMPYTDMREWKEGFGIIETVRKNFKGSTREEILKAKLSRKTQSMVGNPPVVRFK